MVGGVDTFTNSSCPGVVVLWDEILALLDYTNKLFIELFFSFIVVDR